MYWAHCTIPQLALWFLMTKAGVDHSKHIYISAEIKQESVCGFLYVCTSDLDIWLTMQINTVLLLQKVQLYNIFKTSVCFIPWLFLLASRENKRWENVFAIFICVRSGMSLTTFQLLSNLLKLNTNEQGAYSSSALLGVCVTAPVVLCGQTALLAVDGHYPEL